MATFTTTDGKTLFYETAGTGTPVILVHSLGTDHHLWDRLYPQLAENYHVVRYDMYGFGQSPIGDTLTIHHRQDLAELMAHLGIDKAIIAGVSVGSQVVYDFATMHPDKMLGLVLCGFELDGYDYPEEMFADFGWWQEFMGHLQAGELEKGRELFIKHALEGQRTPVPAAIRAQIDEMVGAYDFRHLTDETLTKWEEDTSGIERLPQLTCPTITVVGGNDYWGCKMVNEYMAEHGPTVEMVYLEDAAHLIPLHPEFDPIMLDFVQKVAAQ